MTKQNRNTWLFFGFLLLGGITNLLTRTRISVVDTFMFSANFMIYIGLLIFWMQSVWDRLLPTRARSYILASALLMIFYLLVRVLRFRILTEVVIRRYVDYAYNIPMVLVPTLFLMTCIRISRGEETDGKGKDRLLLIPACAMLLLIMTNDLHQLFYHRLIPLSEFHGIVGTYTYGPLFYLMYVWMVITMITGLVILIRKTYRQNIRGLVWFAGVAFIWAGLSLLNRLVFTPLDLARMYHAPEIQVFGMVGSFEVCIRNRFIPYNENYTGFFSHLGLPVRITDEAFKTVYETDLPVQATAEQLSAAVQGLVYVDEDTRLLGMKIRPSCAFWTEDESELHREGRRLASANELLREENDLIAVENELKEKKAHLDAQTQVYDRIAAALFPKQKRIEAHLFSFFLKKWYEWVIGIPSPARYNNCVSVRERDHYTLFYRNLCGKGLTVLAKQRTIIRQSVSQSVSQSRLILPFSFVKRNFGAVCPFAGMLHLFAFLEGMVSLCE